MVGCISFTSEAGTNVLLQLLYYTRFGPRMEEMLAIVLTAALLGLTWLGSMLTFFLECRPLSLIWQVEPFTPHCAVSSSIFYISYG